METNSDNYTLAVSCPDVYNTTYRPEVPVTDAWGTGKDANKDYMSGQHAYSPERTNLDTWKHGVSSPHCYSRNETVSDTYSHVRNDPDTFNNQVHGRTPTTDVCLARQ